MAEPLKNSFGPEIPQHLATMISHVHPTFPAQRFVRSALAGYAPLGLLARGRHIAGALRRHLPADYEQAIEILLASLNTPHTPPHDQTSMASFFYLPHVCFVAEYGVEHFDASMRAQYLLTQWFTAEFSIRPFLERYPEATLAILRTWATDPSPDVRRLVSEGTRPRLPWAPRLRAFQRDPRPVLQLLELLKDDPALYVRRSVANNLNDIGKDHPDLLAQTAKAWLRGASDERRWIIHHALRSAVKRGEPGALRVLGAHQEARVRLSRTSITPSRVRLGGSVTLAVELGNPQSTAQRLIVDFCIHFVKASGHARPKVFKLTSLQLAPGERVSLRKSVTLKPLTTRRHYPGRHRVDLLINGRPLPLGAFTLQVRPA